MQLLQKARETLVGWLDISHYSPAQQFAIVGGPLAFYLVGLILDWDWCVASSITDKPGMRWLRGQSRRTKRIALGIMVAIIIVGVGYYTVGRSH